MRVSYNNINRGFVTDYEENDDDEASKHSIRVHIYMYISNILNQQQVAVQRRQVIVMRIYYNRKHR